jgi:hypothetical protein
LRPTSSWGPDTPPQTPDGANQILGGKYLLSLGGSFLPFLCPFAAQGEIPASWTSKKGVFIIQAKKTGFRKEFGDQQGYFFRKFWENFRALPEFLSALPETGNF